MAFNLRTISVTKKGDLYTATYEAYDDEDAEYPTKTFPIEGGTKQEIKDALTIKIAKLKAAHDARTAWILLSDDVLVELRSEGVI